MRWFYISNRNIAIRLKSRARHLLYDNRDPILEVEDHDHPLPGDVGGYDTGLK